MLVPTTLFQAPCSDSVHKCIRNMIKPNVLFGVVVNRSNSAFKVRKYEKTPGENH